MRSRKTRLLVGLFLVGVTQCPLWAGAAPSGEYTGDFVLHREIRVSLAAGTPAHPRLVEVPWIRVETVYGNCWRVTARVGWSAATETTWRIRVELLDDQGSVLHHPQDRPTTFTCQAEGATPGAAHQTELTLEPMHWEGRRHAAKIRVHLEPVVAAPGAGARINPLEITAVDSAGGKPIAGAVAIVQAGFFGTRYWSHTFLLTTDAQGKCRVAPEGRGLGSLTAMLQKDGYATMMKTWSNDSSWPIDQVPLADLPERHVMQMEPAQTLGGVVQDQAGRPIADTEVKITAQLDEAGGMTYVSRSLQTDKEGRWQVEGIPSEADTVSLGFKHPEYLSDTWASRHVTGEDLLTLRDRTHVIRMTRGLTVSGRALDDQGRPIFRAAVVLAPAYRGGFHYEHAYTLSDADGRFRFGCAGNDLTNTTPDGGSTGVLVEAPGYVPALRRVVVEPNLAPLEFRLHRGRALTVRVVDANDRPIAEAMPVVYPLLEDRRYGIWLADTDTQGRFQIPHAPESDMLLTVLKSGYVGIRDYTLPASGDEPVVKMKPAPKIQGTVRDDQTGELIQDFFVGARHKAGAGTRDGEPSRFKGGKFELTIDEATPESLQLRILAAGYAEATSETIRLEGTHGLEFKLTKDPSFDARAIQRTVGGARSGEALVIKGTVVDPNGRPAPRVAMGILPLHAMETVTDTEGKFKLRCLSKGPSMETEVPYLIARDRQRNLAAAVEFDPTATEDLTIRLAPGVILAGKVTDVEGKGIRGTQMSLTFWTGRIGYSMREEAARPDPNGCYEIRAVLPDQRYSVTATAEGYGRNYIDARTTEVVSNRMQLEPMILNRANLDISGTVVDAEGDPIPGANVSCYGRGQSNRQVKTDAQGRFTIRGVSAGIAQVQANTTGQTRLYGRVQTEGGATDVKIVLSPMGTPGQFVPARGPSLVGKPLPSLAGLGIDLPPEAYKGKLILLCFFDLGQRPSRNTVLQLAKRTDLKDKGLAVVMVQVSKTEEAGFQEWVRQNAIPFPVGRVLGDENKVRSAWGVRSLPWLILADAARFVRAEGFSLDELDSTLARTAALQK